MSFFAFQDIITSVTGVMILVTLMLAVSATEEREDSPRRMTERVSNTLDKELRAAEREIASLQHSLQATSGDLQSKAALHPETLRGLLTASLAEGRRLAQSGAVLNQELESTKNAYRRVETTAKEREAESDELASVRREREAAERRIEELRRSNRVIYNPGADRLKKSWLVEYSGTGIRVARMGVSEVPRGFASFAAFKAWADGLRAADNYAFVVIRPTAIPLHENVLDYLDDRGWSFGYDAITDDVEVMDRTVGAGK